MSRSLLFIAALALTAGACTVHRHYHQAPNGAYYPAPENPELATRQTAPDHDSDRPLPPEYAKPAYDDGYDTGDGYTGSIDDGYSYGYERYEERCECDHERARRRPAIRRPAPRYRRHPGPVIPDNPVEWLE